MHHTVVLLTEAVTGQLQCQAPPDRQWVADRAEAHLDRALFIARVEEEISLPEAAVNLPPQNHHLRKNQAGAENNKAAFYTA